MLLAGDQKRDGWGFNSDKSTLAAAHPPSWCQGTWGGGHAVGGQPLLACKEHGTASADREVGGLGGGMGDGKTGSNGVQRGPTGSSKGPRRLAAGPADARPSKPAMERASCRPLVVDDASIQTREASESADGRTDGFGAPWTIVSHPAHGICRRTTTWRELAKKQGRMDPLRAPAEPASQKHGEPVSSCVCWGGLAAHRPPPRCAARVAGQSMAATRRQPTDDLTGRRAGRTAGHPISPAFSLEPGSPARQPPDDFDGRGVERTLPMTPFWKTRSTLAAVAAGWMDASR